jgi:hypothetical protein
MTKSFKNNLIAALALLTSAVAFGQQAKIDGKVGSAITIAGVDRYASKFVATGCPSPYTYDWRFQSANGIVSEMNAPGDWDEAYGTGTGPDGRVNVQTVVLNDPKGDGKDPYSYLVRCKSPSGEFGTYSRVFIRMIPRISDYRPTISVQRLECSDADDTNTGTTRLRADGCFGATRWVTPNGTVWNAGDEFLTLSGNLFQEGTYTAECKFDNVVGLDGFYSQKGFRYGLRRAIGAPNVSISAIGPPDASTKEVCKGETVVINSSYDINKYRPYVNAVWLMEEAESKGLYGAAARGATGTETETLTAKLIADNSRGKYFIRLTPKDAECPTKTSNEIMLWYIKLPKPSIVGNSKYCLDATTTLAVKDSAFVLNQGYLYNPADAAKSKPTRPEKFNWFVNGVAAPSYGTKPTFVIGSNVSVSVNYVSNYGCTSDLSDSVAVTNYARPVKPTIKALTDIGFCEDKPIQAKLESSDLPNGQLTKYLWSNALSTKIVDITKAGFYTVRIIDTLGCFSLPSDTTEIKVFKLPAAPSIAVENGLSPIFCQRSDADFNVFNAVNLVATTNFTTNWFKIKNKDTSSVSTGKVYSGVKETGLYYAKVTDGNRCISKESSPIKVIVQENPVQASSTIGKEGVYTLRALKFNDPVVGGGKGGDYEWKFGSTLLTSKLEVTKVKTAGDYTVRRRFAYVIEGTPLNCFTQLKSLTYAVDPEFSGVAIYPNPIVPGQDGTVLSIQILEDWPNADVTIFDMVGRIVYVGKLENTLGTNKLKLDDLANGIYILQIKAAGDKSFVGKIIVSK